METKFTKGEWNIAHGANYIPSITSPILHQPIAHLCNMTDSKKFCEEAEANAKLIVAALKMFEVCEMIMQWWAEHQYDTSDHGEYNVYDEEPSFVTEARNALKSVTE